MVMKANSRFSSAAAFLVVGFLCLDARVPLAQEVFVPTGNLSAGRIYAGASLLPNGKVLISGGFSCITPNITLASADVYDPSAGTFSPTANVMSISRSEHPSVPLFGGLVLLPGGSSSGFHPQSDLYDPSTNSF